MSEIHPPNIQSEIDPQEIDYKSSHHVNKAIRIIEDVSGIRLTREERISAVKPKFRQEIEII